MIILGSFLKKRVKMVISEIDFKFGVILGEGVFGKVYECFDKSDNDKKVCCLV